MKKVKSILCLAIICLSFPFVAQAAIKYPAVGALAVDAGESDTKVFCRIWDHKAFGSRDDKKNYAVLAKVKVGSTVYSSGWKIGEAFKSANRVWYANETSDYDYKSITTKYKSDYSNWGDSY